MINYIYPHLADHRSSIILLLLVFLHCWSWFFSLQHLYLAFVPSFAPLLELRLLLDSFSLVDDLILFILFSIFFPSQSSFPFPKKGVNVFFLFARRTFCFSKKKTSFPNKNFLSQLFFSLRNAFYPLKQVWTNLKKVLFFSTEIFLKRY